MGENRSTLGLDEQSLALLREIIQTGAETNQYPQKAAIDVRYIHEPWVVDELTGQHGLATMAGLGVLIPTIAGLKVAETPYAKADIERVQQLLANLKELYKTTPKRRWTTVEVANALGEQEILVSRLLALLFSHPGIIEGSSTSSPDCLVQIIDLRPTFLREDPFRSELEHITSPSEEGPIRHVARDFMGLVHVDWSPEGVCLIVGPNGSGKSSLLQSLAFLRDVLNGGINEALTRQQGASGIKRLSANPKDDPFLAFGVGNVHWELRLPIGERIRNEFPGEVVKIGDTVFLRRGINQAEWYLGSEKRITHGSPARSCLKASWDAQAPPVLEPLIRILSGFRLYHNYSLNDIRQGGGGSELDQSLEETGANLLVVLRNWKGAPREFDHQFDWVMGHLRKAFGSIVEDIEFGPPMGQIIPAKFFPKGSKTGLPLFRAAEGLLVGLLHLTAVAGAQEGAILAIEEMENFLHPHAIRCILAAMREMAERRGLTILLSTHSPLLMNAFRDCPEQVYVMERGHSPLPTPLDKLHDPDWLAHFELGDLYDRQEFGAACSSKNS